MWKRKDLKKHLVRGSDILDGKTHVTVGLGTAAVVAVSWFPTLTLAHLLIYPAAGIATAAAGAKLADIDISQSEEGKKHPFLSHIFTHRGITHTFLFPAMAIFIVLSLAVGKSVVATEFLGSLFFGFTVGYISHIFADDLNLKGTMTFWPLCKEHLHVMAITTGTAQETIFAAVYSALCLTQIICTLGGFKI